LCDYQSIPWEFKCSIVSNCQFIRLEHHCLLWEAAFVLFLWFLGKNLFYSIVLWHSLQFIWDGPLKNFNWWFSSAAADHQRFMYFFFILRLFIKVCMTPFSSFLLFLQQAASWSQGLMIFLCISWKTLPWNQLLLWFFSSLRM